MERVEFVSNIDRKHNRKVAYPTTMIELPIWTMVHQCNCKGHGKRWGGFKWRDINQYPSPITCPQHIILCDFMQMCGNKLWRIKCNNEEQWRTPNSSKDPNVGPSSSGRKRSRGTLPSSQHLKGRGACWSSGMGLGRIDKLHSLTRACTKPSQSD
jgi:hypothetical protein